MRRAALVLGLLVLALVWGGPLLSVWRDSFAAHMIAHMGVVALAAPLIAIGLDKHIGRKAVPFAFSLPILASLVELAVVWGWHAPAMRALSERSTAATVIEQATFLLAGLLLWTSSLSARGAGQAGAGAFALLLTSIHMTLLGALLSLSPRPLYGAGDVTCFGTVLSAEQDQQFGGVAMLLVGAAVYLAGGLYLLSRTLAEPPERAAG